jgi:Tfp pilus assembly protein PilO
MPSTFSLNTPYIVISSVVVLSIIAVFTVIQPLLGDIRNDQRHLQDLQSQLAQRQQFLQNLDVKRSQLAAQAPDEQKLNVTLPTTPAYADVVRVVALAANDSGATVARMDNRSASAQADVNSQRARGQLANIPADVSPLATAVTIKSSYEQLRTFLSDLQKSPRLNDVLQITSKGETVHRDVLDTDLIIQFYYRAPAAAAVTK